MLNQGFIKKVAVCCSFIIMMTALIFPQSQVFAKAKRGLFLSETEKKVGLKKGISLYFGEKKPDLDLFIAGKKVDEKAKWWTKNTKILKVDKEGVITPLTNGKAVVAARYQNIDFRVTVQVKTKAEKLSILDGTEEITETVYLKKGETKTFKVHYTLSEEAKAAGGKKTSFLTVVDVDDEDVLKAIKGRKDDLTIEAKNVGEAYITLFSGENKKKLEAGDAILEAELNVIVLEEDETVGEEDVEAETN